MATERMKAAMAAVSAHTWARDVDDDGRPAEIGVWHTLYSLADLAEAEGTTLQAVADEAARVRAGERRLYLVRVQDEPGPSTVSAAVTLNEYEVSAPSLKEACALVRDGNRRHPDVRPRTSRQAYTNEYLAPDHGRYAAYGAIRARRPEDLAAAAVNAAETGLAPALAFPELRPAPATGAEAGRAAVAAFSETLGGGAGNSGKALLGLVCGIIDLCERTGEDFGPLLKDCLEQRDDIMGKFDEPQEPGRFVAGPGYGYGA